jgi:hypothetical protein
MTISEADRREAEEVAAKFAEAGADVQCLILNLVQDHFVSWGAGCRAMQMDRMADELDPYPGGREFLVDLYSALEWDDEPAKAPIEAGVRRGNSAAPMCPETRKEWADLGILAPARVAGGELPAREARENLAALIEEYNRHTNATGEGPLGPGYTQTRNVLADPTLDPVTVRRVESPEEFERLFGVRATCEPDGPKSKIDKVKPYTPRALIVCQNDEDGDF